jgi:hypothetical protein
MPTPFDPFKNSILKFSVDDPSKPDITDSAGNPKPAQKTITITAFLKPDGVYGVSRNIADKFPGLGVNSVTLKGYVTSNNGRLPAGISPGDRTTYCKYRDQVGTGIWLLDVQSSVKADLITGESISIIFQQLGGE